MMTNSFHPTAAASVAFPKCQGGGSMDYYYFYMECDIQGQQYFIYNGMQRVWVTVKLYSWFIALNSLLQIKVHMME